MGIHRTRFLIETVEDFKEDLKLVGSNLLYSWEKPDVFIKKIIEWNEKHNRDTIVAYQKEVLPEEKKIEEEVNKMVEAKAAEGK